MLLFWVETRIITYAGTHIQKKCKHGGSSDVLLMLRYIRPIGRIYRFFHCYSLSDPSPGHQDLMMLGTIVITMIEAYLLKML